MIGITSYGAYIPRLRLSNTYKDLIAKGRLSKAEGDYLREKVVDFDYYAPSED